MLTWQFFVNMALKALSFEAMRELHYAHFKEVGSMNDFYVYLGVLNTSKYEAIVSFSIAQVDCWICIPKSQLCMVQVTSNVHI